MTFIEVMDGFIRTSEQTGWDHTRGKADCSACALPQAETLGRQSWITDVFHSIGLFPLHTISKS